MTQPVSGAVGNADLLPAPVRGRFPHPQGLAPWQRPRQRPARMLPMTAGTLKPHLAGDPRVGPITGRRANLACPWEQLFLWDGTGGGVALVAEGHGSTWGCAPKPLGAGFV